MNPNKNILPQKNLEHSKNIDVDTLFLEMENQTLAEARIKSKSCYQSPNFSPLIDNPRDPDHFDNVVITRLKSESLESFLSSYSIKGSTLGSLSLLIGKVVYSFKVYNSQTSFTWPLKKTITEFDKLFKQLKKYLCKEKIIKSINVKCIDFLGVNGDRKIVAFDYTFCKKTEESKSHDILVYLEEFLNTLLEYREIRKTSLLLDFLEVSCIYYPSSSKKYKECYLKKKPGGRFRQGCGTTFCNAIFSLWITRWFMISEDGIKYCTGPSKDKCMIKEMLLFDNSFKLEYGFKQTGSVFGINLITTSRKLVLKTTSLWELYDLIGSIEDAIKNCAYIQENRFCSFAPQRNQLTYCKAFVDGEGYYSDLFEVL